MADEELEQLRNAYRALGPGFPAEAQSLFSEDAEADGGRLVRQGLGRDVALPARQRARHHGPLRPAGDLGGHARRGPAADLQARRRDRDRFHVLPARGSWENMRIPLLHVWTMRLGKALRFENLLDGIELSRVAERRAAP